MYKLLTTIYIFLIFAFISYAIIVNSDPVVFQYSGIVTEKYGDNELAKSEGALFGNDSIKIENEKQFAFISPDNKKYFVTIDDNSVLGCERVSRTLVFNALKVEDEISFKITDNDFWINGSYLTVCASDIIIK
jgi:hypothetical protein